MKPNVFLYTYSYSYQKIVDPKTCILLKLSSLCNILNSIHLLIEDFLS